PLRALRFSDLGARWLDRVVANQPLSRRRAERLLARRLADAGLAVPHPDGCGAPGVHEVAVVIPACDDADGVRRTLAALGEVGEVIVVDDGSVDPVLPSEAPHAASILRNHVALGPGRARQIGWQQTSKPFVAFVDADVEPSRGWLQALLGQFADPA